MTTFFWIALYALLAMITNSIGIGLMYKKEKWAIRNKEHFMCFAAGILITSPLVVAFPEAVSMHDKAGIAALIGFLFMFFINKISKEVNEDRNIAFGVVSLVGIGLHSLIDGIIYSVTFNASLATGMLAGIGLVAHEFAEGVITFTVLSKAGVGKKKAGIIAFLVAAMTTPIGAFISYPIINTWSTELTGLALGFVVGVLIYTSAAHLLPEIEESGHKHSATLLLGVFLGLVSGVLH